MNNRFSEQKPAPHLRLLFWPLRAFFYLLYHQMSWTYDWVAATVSLGLWKSWVLSVIPYLQGSRILELGHGPGHLQKALWQSGTSLTVFGLDASLQMSRRAARHLRSGAIKPNLVNGMAQWLPFTGGAFECVVSTFPTEYIFNPVTMNEVYRVLSPGGRLVVLASAALTGKRRSEQTAAWLFKVTGQSSPWEKRLLDPLRQSGFYTRLEEVHLKTSLVMIILAEKLDYADQNYAQK